MDLIINQHKSTTMLPKVMRAAIRLFVQRGVEATTIKDIAKAAGVSVGALYNHFKGKQELAYHLFSTHLQAFTEVLNAAVESHTDFHEKIQTYTEICFDAFEDNRDLFVYLIVSENREFRKYRQEFPHPGTIARTLIEKGQREGVCQRGDANVLSALLTGVIIRLCVMRMYGGLEEDLRIQTSMIADSIWKGLQA